MSADGDIVREAITEACSFAIGESESKGHARQIEAECEVRLAALARLEAAEAALNEVKNLASDPFASDAVALRACLLAAYDGLGLPTGIDPDAPERQIARALIADAKTGSAEAQRDALAEALRTICDIGETRDVEVARAALADVGLIADSDTTTEWKS